MMIDRIRSREDLIEFAVFGAICRWRGAWHGCPIIQLQDLDLILESQRIGAFDDPIGVGLGEDTRKVASCKPTRSIPVMFALKGVDHFVHIQVGLIRVLPDVPPSYSWRLRLGIPEGRSKLLRPEVQSQMWGSSALRHTHNLWF